MATHNKATESDAKRARASSPSRWAAGTMSVRRPVLLLVAVGLLPACASIPKAPPLSPSQPVVHGASSREVFLPECDVECPEDAALYCRERLNALYNALVATEIFREVVVGGGSPKPGDYIVDLYDFPRRPYWATPAHNPAFALLAVAIPFWWYEPLGFYFSIRQAPDGNPQVVDTRWGGTMIMGSLSPLLNVLPSRTFQSARTQDVERLRSALIGR
jgi:hypothetical protein